MVAVYPEGIKEANPDQQDSVWFQYDMNPIATVVHEGKEASVYCVGDVRVLVAGFMSKSVDDIIDFGIHNDAQLSEAEERGDIEFINNNWFEVLDPALDDVTGIICHTLSDAIAAAEEYVQS